jgi:hypothetical protein
MRYIISVAFEIIIVVHNQKVKRDMSTRAGIKMIPSAT